MQSLSFKAGVRATTLLVMLAALGPGQEVQELSPVSPPATTVKTLPLDAATRSTLVEAIGKRNYTAAEELLAAEASKNPKSQPILLVLANVLFLDGKQTLRWSSKRRNCSDRSMNATGFSWPFRISPSAGRPGTRKTRAVKPVECRVPVLAVAPSLSKDGPATGLRVRREGRSTRPCFHESLRPAGVVLLGPQPDRRGNPGVQRGNSTQPATGIALAVALHEPRHSPAPAGSAGPSR